MFRALLTLCFTLTSLFGQVICCCAATPSQASASTPQPVSEKRSCCTPEKAPQLPSQPSKQPTKEHCPCEKGKQPLVLRAERPDTNLAVVWSALASEPLSSATDGLILVRNASANSSDSVPRCSQLSTDTLLYAHHRLRC
jgi:hypothetical protein